MSFSAKYGLLVLCAVVAVVIEGSATVKVPRIMLRAGAVALLFGLIACGIYGLATRENVFVCFCCGVAVYAASVILVGLLVHWRKPVKVVLNP
jgi:hypothetical protein